MSLFPYLKFVVTGRVWLSIVTSGLLHVLESGVVSSLYLVGSNHSFLRLTHRPGNRCKPSLFRRHEGRGRPHHSVCVFFWSVFLPILYLRVLCYAFIESKVTFTHGTVLDHLEFDLLFFYVSCLRLWFYCLYNLDKLFLFLRSHFLILVRTSFTFLTFRVVSLSSYFIFKNL